MWIDDGEYIIRCGCGDIEHPTYFGFDVWHFKGDEHQSLDIAMTIDDAGFWGRVKNAIFYIFKNKKFWHYGTITLDLAHPKEREEIEGLVKYLRGILDKTK